MSDALLRLRSDFPFFAEKCLKIRDKDGGLVPFRLNAAQQYAHRKIEEQKEKTGKVRAIILKGRQQGLSTYTEGRFYWKVSGEFGKSAWILTHRQDATDNLFGMVNRFHTNMPDALRPSTKKSNAKELSFDKLQSGYRVSTAGGKGSGRATTAQYFHSSESAFYPDPDEIWAAIGQTIPNSDGTEIIIESTANGIGDNFHQRWMDAVTGESEYVPIFIPWFWQPEYRMQLEANEELDLTDAEQELVRLHKMDKMQLKWRRQKIKSDFGGREEWFNQEYPCTPEEAFVSVGADPFITQADVHNGMRPSSAFEADGPLIIGVDPARSEKRDCTALIRRRGRIAFGADRFWTTDLMHTVGTVARIIDTEKPDMVFIDVGGLGSGVYDRLIELGYGWCVTQVNFGSAQVYDDRKWKNRRAEMWGSMRDWLRTEGGVCLPDDKGLRSELISPGYKRDSEQRVTMESKEELLKRGIKSTNMADALGLTFAEPVSRRSSSSVHLPGWRARLGRLRVNKPWIAL